MRNVVAVLGEAHVGTLRSEWRSTRKWAVIAHLREITGLDFVTAGYLVELTSGTGVFIGFSGASAPCPSDRGADAPSTAV